MNLTMRLVVALALVLLIHGGVRMVQKGGMPTNVELPAPGLDALPMELDGWKGQSFDLDPRLFQATGASAIINRVYEKPGESPISLHLAAITDYGEEGVDHFPETCYVTSGYTMVDKQRRKVESDAGALSAVTSTWKRDDDQAQILYWYQFGPDIIANKDELRTARRKYWGSESWPAVIKVLLQTSASSPESARARLTEFARPLYGWTRTLSVRPDKAK